MIITESRATAVTCTSCLLWAEPAELMLQHSGDSGSKPVGSAAAVDQTRTGHGSVTCYLDVELVATLACDFSWLISPLKIMNVVFVKIISLKSSKSQVCSPTSASQPSRAVLCRCWFLSGLVSLKLFSHQWSCWRFNGLHHILSGKLKNSLCIRALCWASPLFHQTHKTKSSKVKRHLHNYYLNFLNFTTLQYDEMNIIIQSVEFRLHRSSQHPTAAEREMSLTSCSLTCL